MTRPPLSSLEYRPSWLPDCSGLHLVVVGADGFVGSHVVTSALAAGAASVKGVCVREPWRLAELQDERLELVREREWWALDSLEGDAVVLLAYEPPPSSERAKWLEHELSVNAAGVRRLAQVARRRGARVLFASSADVYGPWHEEPVTEDMRPKPGTPYAEAKLAVEEALAGEGGDWVALRIATVYGPSEHERRAIPSFARALLDHRPAIVHGDGSDIRDYVYVGDVAAAFVACCVPSRGRELLNVGSGRGRSTMEVLGAVAHAVGVEPRVEFHNATRPTSRLVLSTATAVAELDFEPRSDFAKALREEVEWLASTRSD